MIPDKIKNIKIFVKNPSESRRCQEDLFKLGCEWRAGGREPSYLNKNYLYVHSNGSLSYGDNQYGFDTSNNRKVLVQSIMPTWKERFENGKY